MLENKSLDYHANNDRDLLQSSVRTAGQLALKLQRLGVKQWDKPDGSIVTEADLEVDAYLKSKLAGARPDYGWLSEESPDNPSRLKAKRTWIVDPIDGTRSFARNGDSWCIGASLVENGRPVLACIFHPQLDRFYFAEKSKGSWLNSEPLTIANQTETLQHLRVMGPKPVVTQLEKHGAIHVPAKDTPLLARLAMLASGELDAAVSIGAKHDWDLAPGELLVTEAGGTVTGIHNETPLYNQLSRQQSGLVAAAPARHKTIMKILEPS